MKSMPSENVYLILCWLSFLGCHQHITTSAFTATSPNTANHRVSSFSSSTTSSLRVSIGLGPESDLTDEEAEDGERSEGYKNNKKIKKKELVAGVDYEVPDHESYRLSRRSNLDEQCDKWFGDLLGNEDQQGIMGSLADDARKILTTPVPLINEVCLYMFVCSLCLGVCIDPVLSCLFEVRLVHSHLDIYVYVLCFLFK
jgi:hypothetical protein